MIGEYYDYKGEKLTQAQIAQREGINRSTLADWFKKTGSMELAVDGARKSFAQRNIDYNGEILNLKAIAERENIKFETLKKNLEETNNIYEAVRLTLESKQKRNGDILYKGQMMTANAIAELEDLDAKSLRRYIEESEGNIEEAVRLAKEGRDLHRGNILYNGRIMSISGIAAKEGIKRETLKEYFDLYGNIDKAVLITKKAQSKRREALLRGKKVSHEDLSKYLGISRFRLEKMLKAGITPEEIERKQKRGAKKEEQIRYDETSLYRYCLDNSYNYWVILYLIRNYNKTPEEAIEGYIKNGQQTPNKWIYEKYDVLLKHLVLKFGIDSNRLVKIMKENNCPIEDAVQELVFITNNDPSFKKAEIDWLKELYPFLKELSKEEFGYAKETFFITDRELDFLKDKDRKIEIVKRQLLLFEFSQIIDIWPREELLEMLDLYNVSSDERKTIALDLYRPFNNGVIDVAEDSKREALNRLVLDKEASIDNLPETDKEYIKGKRKILEIIDPQGSAMSPNIAK